MQTVIGRIVSNAKIFTLKDERQVINFTVAQNHRFKVKGQSGVKQVTNFFNCAYWMGTGIADHLKKGVLVEVTGSIGLNAWQSADGAARASLTLHVQQIQLHGKAGNASTAVTEPTAPIELNEDGLPF